MVQSPWHDTAARPVSSSVVQTPDCAGLDANHTTPALRVTPRKGPDEGERRRRL